MLLNLVLNIVFVQDLSFSSFKASPFFQVYFLSQRVSFLLTQDDVSQNKYCQEFYVFKNKITSMAHRLDFHFVRNHVLLNPALGNKLYFLDLRPLYIKV